MSAAAPPPPPHYSSIIPPSSGYNVHRGSATSNGAVLPSTPPGGEGVRPVRQRPPFLHLQDLVAAANDMYRQGGTLAYLLRTAHELLKLADASAQFRRPDSAYTEYIAASTIVTSVIPRHPECHMLLERAGTHNELAHKHKTLIKEVNARHDQFQAIRDLIVEDNSTSGVQPIANNAQTHSPQPEKSRPYSQYPDSSKNGLVHVELGQNSAVSSVAPQEVAASSRSSNQEGGSLSSPSRKAKPPVQPKPPTLHSIYNPNGQRAPVASNGSDTLTARFARLRTADALPNLDSESGQNNHNLGSRIAQPHTSSPNSPHSSRIATAAFSNAISNSTRLAGLPNKPTVNGLSRTALSTNVNLEKDLPKPPSPTYSPIRTSHNDAPMRNTMESIMSSSGSTASFTSSGSLTYDSVSNEYANAAAGVAQTGPPSSSLRPVGQPRRKSLNVPQETEISAERLHDYLKVFNVLLIDVRSREEYDTGHIFTQTGMCIEPTALRLNMSAEELQDALVVSPDDTEWALFDQRDQFDLVVYYDQSSMSTAFLSSRSDTNLPLKFLHDALYEFNQEKPLRYPPVFMKGGMDAWIDLLGEQALKSSNTAARVKTGRPIARRPQVTNKLSVQKRRHRDYNPLAPEEEERWRERARSETVVLASQPLVGEVTEEGEVIEPYLRTYDEFYRRFPDVATVEQQSMTVPAPQRAPPEPPRIPSYPTPPVPSAPARPPPAIQRPSYSGVSERALSQNLPSTRAPQLAPYIPPKLKRLPRTGLHNFGATCYMNATIQCLSATIPLTAFFLDGRFENFIQKDNWKGSKGIMPELYTNLLRALWQPNGVDTIRPTNFRKLCARLNREWASERQQDAKEFLEFLVDCLHEDLNVNWARNPLRQLTATEEAERERTPSLVASKTEWTRYEHRDHSRLTDLFAGQHISRLQCTTCKHSSTTYEPFYSISVEIPTASSRNQPVTLSDCLRSYCSSEILSGDEVWRCPACKTSREATKRITISRAPEFLVIHLKRFSASHSERARKIHTPVEFPLTDLDLEPYMQPATDANQRDFILARYGKEALETPRAMQPPYRYDAYAVMRHLGASMGSGHYVGLVRDAARGCWREFNDERIGDFRPEDLPRDRRLQNEMAYIVFYQRVPA